MINHSARRINRLAEALGATRYLEIGVEEGRTFFDINIFDRTAVDPNLLFDYRLTQTDTTHFFKISSDEFFACHSPSAPFDIIFIDGLHTFEQALRDLLNSLLFVHERSVILLDDVWPSDVFSACRSPVEALQQRHLAGGSDLAWHGDVYKVVFFIAEMMPSLTYGTIEDGGTRQTVIYRKARPDFRPEFGSIEKIERLSYFDFLKRADVMRLGSEESILIQTIADLAD